MNFAAIVPPDMTATWAALADPVFEQAINTELGVIQDDFALTYQTWKSGPSFVLQRAAYQGPDMVGECSTDNEIYSYVNFGTVPHDIFPVKAKKLHFMSGYTAKTTKRVIGSQAGGPSGSDVFSAGVHHPGSEGREFDLAIQEKRQPDFESLVTDLIAQAVSRIS